MRDPTEILTPMQQLALAKKGSGETRAEIARSLGVTPKAIKQRWARARKRMLRAMTPEERKYYTDPEPQTRIVRAAPLI